MINLFCRFASLSWEERFLLCISTVLLLSCRVLLALFELDRTRRGISRLVRASPAVTSVEDPDQITWAVTSANTVLPGSGTCLSQAIVGATLLAAHGFPATVRLGVANPETAFEAHAWVEREGTVVVGDLTDLDRYRRISSWTVSA
ncbi:lasso peptide biosynthesis B2 protein [Halobellus marinus]|uniref:lasso peptide biosynthesis B2 protein n=1 Tax=Halobellus TaxID=1073986 RepID=UPI0028A9ABAB|nr:lasso peptide biosynthesis B2 protein [Halobellus sp. DFY28]